ncbi:MAG TPA: hypothetical protein VM680_14590 [Verrucomicrobiae bacterium]|nr:hypothetical protein [Verrucomicrobiae bacterium]
MQPASNPRIATNSGGFLPGKLQIESAPQDKDVVVIILYDQNWQFFNV